MTSRPTPTNAKEVISWLRTCSYYRRFIKDFSKIARPLLTCSLPIWERTAPVHVPLASMSKINSFSRHGYIKIGLEVKACFNILKNLHIPVSI
jgi:hypothetical protein